ncbi:MAG: DUF1405 domain-containing protein [Candidatus Micrarchaeia archaeon]|jgi:uncharacterized membrane protein YpjA
MLSPRIRNLLFWVLVLGNLLGALYGFTLFYGAQMLASPAWQWPFIPDCPLFSLLFAISMLLLYTGVRGRLATLFNFLTFVGCVKYGFWTVFVLTYYRPFYTDTTAQLFLSTLLLVSHIVLFFQAFLLASYVRPKPWHLAAVLGFMLLSDLSDYSWLTHPWLPGESLALLFPLTVAMSIIASIGGYFILRRAERPLLPLLPE